MAVTGTGTQADPWVVHNYTELNTVFNSYISASSGHYVRLDNDINGNDYDDLFEWNTVSNQNSSNWFDLDLNGYAIKNIKVASNNQLFYDAGNTATFSQIRNGKLLNIFLDGASYFIACSGKLYLKNVSASINGTGISSYVTSRVLFENTSVYFESAKLNAMPFSNFNEQIPCFKNSDILLAISDVNGKRIIGKDTNYGGTSIGLDNCRIRGYIKGATASNCVVGMCSMANSVCDLDMLQTTHSGIINAFGAGGTGVCNTDKLAEGIAAGGNITNVTSQEIISGDALRAKGFVVVNVSA